MTTTETVKRLMAEGLINMSQAARMLGGNRSGKPTHAATVARKCLTGDRLPDGSRLRLEHVRVANRIMTSEAAVVRYLTAMTEAMTRPDAAAIAEPTPAARNRAAEQATSELDAIFAK